MFPKVMWINSTMTVFSSTKHAAFLYVIHNFPLNNDVLKHSCFLNILLQEFSFESVLYLVEWFQHYISFTKTKIAEMEQESLYLQSLQLDDFTLQAKEEATILVDEDGDSVTYRIDVLWYHFISYEDAW